MDACLEYAKQNGPWAVQLAVVIYLLWRAGKFCADEIVKPLVGVVVQAVPVVASAAVKMRDDLADVKEASARIEIRLAGGSRPSLAK